MKGTGASLSGEAGSTGRRFEAGSASLKDDRALDVVAQLADVARPVVARQLGEDAGREELALVLRRDAEGSQEAADEGREVFDALAERRYVHGHHGEPEVEVLPEAPAVHFPMEVAVGGGDDAHVDLSRPRLAHPPDGARLDGPQELRLELERQLADLVEEHGPAVGRFEGADALAIRAREGAAYVPEELALDEVRRDRAAIDDDERLVGPRTALEDLRRDDLLAGATFALDEDVDVARRDLLEKREELPHGNAGPGEKRAEPSRADSTSWRRRRTSPARARAREGGNRRGRSSPRP